MRVADSWKDYQVIATKKRKKLQLCTSSTQFTIVSTKKTINGKQKMQVQEERHKAEQTRQKYLYLTNSIVPSSMDTRRFHSSLSKKHEK